MYYVTTRTNDYKMTTSFPSLEQARQHGSDIESGELHLWGEDFGDYAVAEYCSEASYDVGRVRTIFESNMDGMSAGKFSLYILDGSERWSFTGITFETYAEANRAVKTVLNRMYGKMLILEHDDPELTLYI